MYDSLIPLIAVLLCTFWGPVVLSAQGHHLMNAGMDRLMWFGGKLFYINTWAMIWPTDYAAHKWKMKKRKKLTLNLAVYDTSDAATWIQHILQKKKWQKKQRQADPQQSCSQYMEIHTSYIQYIQIHTDTYRYIPNMNWIFFDCFIWLYEVCIVCIGSKYMHINTHTVFYLIFMYVCVFICMYVYVFFAAKPVGESILTHTYIYMHIHTNFQKNTYT